MDPPVPGECWRLASPASWGNAVINSAMEGWLLMKPVSAEPHVGSMAGWWVPCGGSPAGTLATVASQKPPPPSFARTGVVGLVFTLAISLPAWTNASSCLPAGCTLPGPPSCVKSPRSSSRCGNSRCLSRMERSYTRFQTPPSRLCT